MYTAMVFHQDKLTGNYNARSVRLRPYTELQNAIQAVKKTGLDGYVKQQGRKAPVWNNLPPSHASNALR